MSRRTSANWRELRYAVESALGRHASFPSSTRIAGRVLFLDAGLNHENFVFNVEANEPLPPGCGRLVLRGLHRREREGSAAIARLQSEAEVLRTLETLPQEIRTPRFLCFVQDPDGVARSFIETAVSGIPIPLLLGNTDQALLNIDAIGRAAAAVHRLPARRFEFLPARPSATEYLSAELNAGDRLCPRDDPDVAGAIAWIRTHRSDERPAVLLHSDLLPQNLLLDIEDRSVGVVDWEYARIGDPAYDLAIVTRGNRKLLGVNRGLHHLLTAYRAAGGASLRSEDVVVWELLLVLRWLGQALENAREGRSVGQPPAFYRDQLRAILSRVRA